MSRFPPKPLSELPDDTKQYGERFESSVPAMFGENGSLMTYRDENGGFIGPFPIIIASKSIGEQLMKVFYEFSSLKGFPSDAKETTILIVGAKFQTACERYAHKRVGIKQAGLTQQQVDALSEGKKPDGLSEGANVANDAAYHLMFKSGPLPDDLYEASVKAFGRDGALAMAHFTGIYSYMCVLMNFADAPLPKGESL